MVRQPTADPRTTSLPLALVILLAGLSAACTFRGFPNTTNNSPDQLPTVTPSVTVTATLQPTATATLTPTITPSPTPTPPHPLSMEWLRLQEYPVSEIVIEEVLERGANYHRFITSYRSQGLKIFALLTLPYGERPDNGWPVIVFNHGYIPPDRYRTTERYVAYVNSLASNGYIVFRPDYRGHGNSEGIARGAYGTPDYVIDVLNAVAAMKGYEEADPQRIGMWGHSMGGYITLRAMLTDPDIQAGVIWAGVVASYPDLLAHWTQRAGTPDSSRSSGRRSGFEEVYGTPEENPEFWASISANSYLNELSAPIQLHHGTADETVPIEFSKTLLEQIIATGGTVELFTYEGDDHNLSKAFSAAMQRSIQFFDLHVKGR
jgi:dipeptidyl aminopeptidase/acylaminoacyl peptidase